MIDLKNVTKVYPSKGNDDVHALNDITLHIGSGEIHGIVGESGAGKSTLIRCLTGLEKPTSGSITINGNDITQLKPRELRKIRRNMGMVFQSANLFDQRTAADNIAYALKRAGFAKNDISTRVNEMLHLVGLADKAHSYPSQLSGGQRQRIGIARAMATTPAVLLCDEPTSALDTETTEQILDLLHNVREKYGVTIAIITHEMNVVRRICDHVTLLDHGTITQSTTVAQAVKDTNSLLARQIIPQPTLDPQEYINRSIVDIAFTSHLGEPTGSHVLSIARSLGADIGAGTFDSLHGTQIARLALTIDNSHVNEALQTFADAGIDAHLRPSTTDEEESHGAS
ncbi:MAG: ATP-binding cassette domain-containing protein [Actinomycetaceae bacterium]|nr:ATP-binding cassette domain-containing protein [Actinomycetaceae bacterium]